MVDSRVPRGKVSRSAREHPDCGDRSWDGCASLVWRESLHTSTDVMTHKTSNFNYCTSCLCISSLLVPVEGGVTALPCDLKMYLLHTRRFLINIYCCRMKNNDRRLANTCNPPLHTFPASFVHFARSTTRKSNQPQTSWASARPPLVRTSSYPHPSTSSCGTWS